MRRIVLHGIDADVATTFLERAKGLIGRRALSEGQGLLIPHCNAIHTLFMRFPIDATFLDRKGEVVKVVRNIRPGRLFVWGGWRARQVLETAPLRETRPSEQEQFVETCQSPLTRRRRIW